MSLSTNSVSVVPAAVETRPVLTSPPGAVLSETHAICGVQVQTLYKYIEQKGDLASLAPLLHSLTKQKTAVTQLAKQGHKDLEELTALLQRLGVKLQVGILMF